MKKVSVIIPMYNSSKYIEQCLKSVVDQTYSNIEIIIIDDASSDDSVEKVKNIISSQKAKDGYDTKWNEIKIIEFEKNKGVALARNKGIDEAVGDYICFLDSDDYWVKDKIEKQVDFIEKNDYSFIYSGYTYLKVNNTTHIVHVPKSINYNEALKNTTIFTSTVMFSMKHLTKDEIYMPNIISQDTATWWKILKKGITAYGLDEVLTFYRVGKKSLSSNKFKAVRGTWNLYKREDINYFKKIYCFICYIYNAIKRRV